MVEGELWNSSQVIEYLGITMNNLRQIQHRKALAWVKKEGKAVFYSAPEVVAYKEKRQARIKR